jgi:nanoRNase/pAp phosphatase (c-di-AMP/oligoRNAs hydrolase)
MLIIDEMRFIEGVKFAAAFKTYPDGKITVKLRANPEARFMDKLAGHFGGGGHPFAAGFKVYDMPYEALKKEFITISSEMLEQDK